MLKKIIENARYRIGRFGRRIGIKQKREKTRQYNNDENPASWIIKKIGYSLIDKAGRDDYSGPEWDFEEIIKAYNSDGYVRQGVDKYIELMFKSGWKFVYKDPRVRDYLEQRMAMLADAMGQPFNQFIKQISEDLVKFHNVFIVKARKNREDLPDIPNVNIIGTGDNDPVAGYFRLPVETMYVKVDEHGTVEKYLQDTVDEEKKFDPENMIHIPYKQPAGKFFGVPFLLPVLEDVKLLRQIEDNIARLIYRHLYPLFVYTVGLKEEGKEAQDKEVEDVENDLNNMPIDGGIVIPERHKVELKAPDSNINAEEYLKYFEKRVFTGLGTSETIMGRSATANRSTAENQSAEARDKVKAFMSVVEDYINFGIIRELLLEGGFNPIINKDHQVFFKFNEIDTNLLIKEENHAVFMYEHNAITHEEMREEINRDPVEDESRLNDNMFNKISDDTDNRNDPENQHTEEMLNVNLNFALSRILSKFTQFKEEFKKIAFSAYNYTNREGEFLEKNKNINKLLMSKICVYTNLYASRTIYDKYDLKNTVNREEVDRVIEPILDSLGNFLLKKTNGIIKERPDDFKTNLDILLKNLREEIETKVSEAMEEVYFKAKVKNKLQKEPSLYLKIDQNKKEIKPNVSFADIPSNYDSIIIEKEEEIA